ncbi:MAG: hypothetical protein QM741_02980 [Rudaea sp.]|uniref:hypothetical protein n=1 Tax=Rudaea sp. TaxID=2136325 RepID=UPI0039E553B5
MKIISLFTVLLAANASGADTSGVLQAQPLAGASAAQVAAKAAVTSKAVASPKLTAAIATRNSDGTLAVGCVERPNPRAGKRPAIVLSPELRQ